MSTEKIATQIRKKQIVLSALRLVATHGMNALKVGSIAGQVGLVPSAIYRHFKNKDEILDELIDFIGGNLAANVRSVRAANLSPIQSLKSILANHAKLVVEYQAIPRILFSDEVYSGNPGRKAKLYSIIKKFLESVAGFIKIGQSQGIIRKDYAPKNLAAAFLGIFQPAVFLWHLTDGSFDMGKQIDSGLRLFINEIQSRDKVRNNPSIESVEWSWF